MASMSNLMKQKPRHRKIITHTRERWSIPNFQGGEITDQLTEKCRKLRNKYAFNFMTFRTDAIPVYNCHGMTFCSRRTTMYGADRHGVDIIRRILADDKYQKVLESDVEPGDIVLYVSATDGDIHHSGIVIKKSDTAIPIPLVLSKWGDGPEVIHPLNRCEYMVDGVGFEYYRIMK